MKKSVYWIKVALFGIAIVFGFAGDSHGFAKPSSRKVSDYKSFTEICLDRENLSKATKDSIEILLWEPIDGSGRPKSTCDEAGRRMNSIISLNNDILDLDLLRFTPNVESLGINGDKVVSDFSGLESLGKLQKLVLSISSLDKLGNIKLKHLRVMYLTITGARLASDVNAFKMMPNFAEFSEGNDTNYDSTGGIILPGLPTISLVLNGGNLTDISALKSAKGLVHLKLQGQQISDISSLSALTHLKRLTICGTRVSNISPLSSLVNLDSLSLRKNRITDFSPLGALAKKVYSDSITCRYI
jgi:internalin A